MDPPQGPEAPPQSSPIPPFPLWSPQPPVSLSLGQRARLAPALLRPTHSPTRTNVRPRWYGPRRRERRAANGRNRWEWGPQYGGAVSNGRIFLAAFACESEEGGEEAEGWASDVPREGGCEAEIVSQPSRVAVGEEESEDAETTAGGGT